MPENIYNPPTSSSPEGSPFPEKSFGKQTAVPTPQHEKKPSKKLKIIIVIIVVILVFGGLAFGFIFAAYPKYFKNNIKNINRDVNSAVNTQINENQNVALNQNVNNMIKVSPSDIDTDKDGLTDLEEEALTTDPKKLDTDGDKYSDSDEIKNGYNPKGDGEVMTTVGLIKPFTNRNFSYFISYPLNFQIKKDTEGKKIEFLAPTEEIIDVTVDDIPSNTTSALDFYLSKNPDVDKNNIKTIKSWFGVEGVLSVDGKSAYYLIDNKAFIIAYHAAETPSYNTIFEMVYRSFRPVIFADANVNVE